jgi:hypothetical protein
MSPSPDTALGSGVGVTFTGFGVAVGAIGVGVLVGTKVGTGVGGNGWVQAARIVNSMAQNVRAGNHHSRRADSGNRLFLFSV